MRDLTEFRQYVGGPSVLNDTDRAYLLDELKIENPQQERDRRQRIRDRVQRALLDFALMYQELDPHDRELIFRGLTDPWQYREARNSDSPTDDDLPEIVREGTRRYLGVIGTIAFLYTGCKQVELPAEELVELAIRDAENMATAGPIGVKNVTVDVKYMAQEDLGHIVSKLRAGEQLSNAEYRHLVNLFYEDHDQFVDSLCDIAIEDAVAANDQLSRGEALVLIATLDEDPSLGQAVKLDQMPEEVIRHFGLTAVQ